MPTIIQDVIWLRRPTLNYVCPPVCEVLFSSTGFPIIVLNPLPRHRGPTGLVITSRGRFRLLWDAYPGALCFTIYQAVNPLDPFGPYAIIAECIEGNEFDIEPGCYRISAITLEGESELSEVICTPDVVPPDAVTTDPSGVSASEATINGFANPNGLQTEAFFEWGTDTSYGNITPAQDIGNGTDPVTVFALLTGLSPNTTYHYRIVAESMGGTVVGDDFFFVSAASGTSVITVQATIPDAYEGPSPISGEFTIYRGGDLSALTVNYFLTGTAINGTDYVFLSGSETFLAGEASRALLITPIDNVLTDSDRTTILTITPSVNYTVGSPNAATVTIHDDETPDAPCSITTGDSTSFGPFPLPGPLSSATWTGLGLGSFQFRSVSGAYKIHDNDCPAFSEDQFYVSAFSQLTWTTTNAQSGHLTNQSHTFTNCSGGNSFGWSLEADAVTAYQAGSQAGFSNINEVNSFTCDTTLTCNVPVTGTSPVPVFEVVRTIKLVAPQPNDLQISGLVNFANSRFEIVYGGQSTSPIALDALAATVQTALNTLPNIILDGGVTCAGTLAGGLAITWNVNGARSLIQPAISTVSPGWSCQLVETQPGNGGQPEIQTLVVAPFCSDLVQDTVLPEYSGAINTRELSFILNNIRWYDTLSPNPNAPTQQISGIQFQDARVTLACCPAAPASAPTTAVGGAGAVEAGEHRYAITFVSNQPQYGAAFLFTNGESPISPVDTIILGVASAVDLTSIPLGPAGTTARRIYRTRVGETEFRRVDEISDNVTTVYTDTTPDANLFLTPPPAEHFWMLTIRGVFDIGGSKANLPMWQGYKTQGLDPVGTYTKTFLSTGFDGLPPCGDTTNSVGAITLTGTF